ncbi:MoaD/ThiS family protein [Ekhidna sp.]|uniref:MoaD/ThiS family protein n=1 Tax=Ekhidna sp. TaxID=2608089 RepID=UPI003298222B
MPITIKYFGAIAEATGITEEKVDLGDVDSIEQLKSICLAKYEAIGDLSFQLAVNQSLSSKDALKDGDEVAFLPPFAGG